MASGQLFLKPTNACFLRQYRSDEISTVKVEHQTSEDASRPPHTSPKPVSKNAKSDQTKKGRKKKSGKGGGAVFRIKGNTINGDKADKAGVFGFGNKYIGHKKREEEESSEEEGDSSEDEE
ncbi:hypothetical protein RchiOBHm_Chr4g0425191 [Rosa chinensis]|uniref:Uncharacterized protein n=1 Tax=Rosa chinensis TaxID=74649 RepID=A0A2P6QZ38_ROSCH|nr:hypothetical protein RchiOBHm_Chr4g0425191 [Rosa chinensis]